MEEEEGEAVFLQQSQHVAETEPCSCVLRYYLKTVPAFDGEPLLHEFVKFVDYSRACSAQKIRLLIFASIEITTTLLRRI